MVRLIGLWMLLITLFASPKLCANAPSFGGIAGIKFQDGDSFRSLPSSELLQSDRNIKSDVLAKIEIMTREDAKKFMKTFDLGELNVLPYAPDCQPKSSMHSQAYFTFKLPDVCGGVKVKTGLCYHLAENQKSGIGSQEQVLYLVSTKTLNDTKWKPFVSLSYLRSQVRGVPRAFYKGLEELQSRSSINYSGPQKRPQTTAYSNVEVVETCCGLQPHKRLSLVLSFNSLKPLDKKVKRLDTYTSKVFDDVKIRKHSQSVGLKVGYKLKEGLNLLVKSECLLSNGSLRDKDDTPTIIDGVLIVSF